MPILSVVIPIFNAADTLHELHSRLHASLKIITEDYEIVFVEDHSNDNSWQIIQLLAKNDSHLRAIRLVRNFGQHIAITAGLDVCDGDYVVVMDCDLQDPPEEIMRLYHKIREGYHVVLANRKHRKDSWFKIKSSFLFYKALSYLSGGQFSSEVGCYRIISRQVVENYRIMQDKIRFFISLVAWMGFPTTSIDIQHSARHTGKSNYSIKKLIRLALDIIIDNSYKPLKFSIFLGVFVSISAFLGGLYIFLRSLLFGVTVTGWSSIMISVFFIGGVTIFNLGLLGIYISKIFDQVKDRPLYIKLEQIGFNI